MSLKLNLVLRPSSRVITNFDYFDLDPDLTFLNHGSYGACPRKIRQRQHDLQTQMERNPDAWFRYDSINLWNNSLSVLANYLRVSQDNLLLCMNATDGLNAVLKSIELKRGDAILATKYTYRAILSTLDYVSKYRKGSDEHIPIYLIDLKLPPRNETDLVQQFDNMCSQITIQHGIKIKIAVLDHIGSAVPIKYPVNRLCSLIRQWSPECRLVVDGAHSIGQIDIKLDQIGCDYYVSNLHKWFLAPRGCSFLYFKDKSVISSLEPNYISYGYGNQSPSLSYNFFARATRDATSYYVVPECVEMYTQQFGGLNLINVRLTTLLENVLKMLVISWNTEVFKLDKSLEAPFMRLVKLPIMKNYEPKDAAKLMKDLLEKYKIVSAFVNINNQLYCRLSAYVYNQFDNYVKLKDAILDLNIE